MDPHGWRSAFHSSPESQVCGGGKSDNNSRKGKHDIYYDHTTPYLEVKEDATECVFKSFEIATATLMKDESENLAPHLSKNT